MDIENRVITFDSLKKNSTQLGLQNLTDNDLRSIMREGDLDCDSVPFDFLFLLYQIKLL
ncbi:hypothetical protein PTKIN_Ptkin03bG0085200 [Pterospermum kingtungense]